MPSATPQIFAVSGPLPSTNPRHTTIPLIEHAVELTGRERPRITYVPTGVGDSQASIDGFHRALAHRDDVTTSHLTLFTQPNVPDVREHLLAQDAVWVGGGSVVNLMAVWRAHGIPDLLRECWEAGVVLAGQSAGSLCWHVGGPTDSFSDALDTVTDTLGWLPFSNGVHDNFPEQPRREVYRAAVATGLVPAGYASEDGVGLHYVGTELREVVTVVEGACGWWVEPAGQGAWREERLEARLLRD